MVAVVVFCNFITVIAAMLCTITNIPWIIFVDTHTLFALLWTKMQKLVHRTISTVAGQFITVIFAMPQSVTLSVLCNTLAPILALPFTWFAGERKGLCGEEDQPQDRWQPSPHPAQGAVTDF